MRRLLLTLLLSAVLAGAALAGVNQNGAIIVHTNDAYTYSSGTRCTTALARPATCEATITRTDRSTTRSVLWFLWAFLPSATPRVTTVYFGMNMDMTCLDPTEFTWAWCSPTGVTPSQDVSGGWPGDGESATVGWPVAITQNLYPFMVIRAGVEQCGAPSTAHICSSINHVGGYAAFVDDSNPPQTDLVTNFGCVRWYQPGVVNCPQALSTGACCFLDGHCELLSQAACEGSPGVLRFLGTGTACEPTNPCPQPGACCNVSTGVCSFTLAELCIPPDFQFIGEGVACTPSPCPLPPPTLQTPLNGATCQSIAGSLTWSDVPDAVGYTVQIGTSCGTGTEYSVGGASYAYSGLLYNTTYHWRVKTRNVVGGHGPYSDCFSFTTLGAPLAAPALLTPANGATCVILPVTLDWADVTGATGYRLRIGATCGAGTEYDVTSSEYVAALNPGTRYFWQVKAKDGCNQYGPYSACYELRTLPSPLPSPVLIFPPNGETGRPTASYLAWDSVPGAAGYKVQIGTSCGSGDEFEVTGPSYDYSGLTEGALYYWRVKTKDSCNQYGNYSECFSFTTALPVLPPPTLETPADGALCQATSGILNWADVGGAVAGYMVQLGTSCGSGPEVEVGPSQYAYSGLDPATVYHWRVKTKNAQEVYGQYSDCFSFTTLPAPLGAPTLLSPADGAVGQPLAGTLDWSDVGGAAGYVVRIGTGCGSGDEYEVASSSYAYSGLAAGTTYFWQVKTKDSCGQFGGYSGCFSFSTSGVSLPPPTLLAPADGATCEAVSGMLDWTDVGGAAAYMVQLGTSCGSGAEVEVGSSQYAYSGLTAGTTYHWRVKTKNAQGEYGSYSNCFSFTTLLAPLGAPALLSPGDGADCQALSGTLDWTDVPAAVAYTVQLGTSCGSGAEVEVGSSQYAYSALTAGTTYHWRVKTKDACGQYGSYSSCFSFTTLPAPLGAPTLLSPADGAVGQPLAGTLDWSDVGGAAGYMVRLGTGCGAGTEYEVASSSYAYSGLAAGVTYFWQVKAKDNCGQFGSYSGCFSFSTSGVSLPPPTLLAPADGATCEAVSGMLDWTDVGGAAAYMVQLGTSCGSGAEVEVGSSQYAYSGLTAGTTYHWRVKTKNAQGEYGSYSNCFSFTTLPAPLGAPALLSPANGAFDQPVALTLDWADVAGAVGYELQVGTSCGVGAIYDMTASMFPLGGLDLATTYFWRVRAKDACDQFGPYSTCFSFRTTECDGVVLGPPTLLTPADDAICQPTAGTLDWSDVDGATGYMVEIATPVRARDTHEVTGSEYDYLLLPGTTYIWRVRTKNCDDVYGSYSSSFTFTTVPAAPLPPPALLTPADGATDVPLDGTLTWSAVPGASAYTVRLGTVCGGGAESEVLGTSYDYAGLVLDTTYFWQVKTKDGCGQYGEYSTCFSFRIPVTSTLPTDPIVQEPNGGEVWPAGTQQDIRWTSGAGGDDVRIELLLNGSVCATIAPSTPDDGSFPWTAAQCGGASTGYKVRITNLRTLYFDDSNGTFSIPGQAAIQVISPNGHERLVWGVPYDIVWVSTNGGPTVRIELLKGDEFCAPIEEAAPNTGSYRWTPVFCQGLGGYRIRVTDNLNGVSDRSDQTFIIKHRRAGPTSDQADGETSVTLPNPYTTNGAITIDLWEDGPVRAAIYNVRGQKVRDLLDASLSGGAYEFSWDGRDAAGVRVRTGIYYLRISANGSDYTRKLLYVH